MAAIDVPWANSMSYEYSRPSSSQDHYGMRDTADWSTAAPKPTVAAFSPNQQTLSGRRSQASIIIHQKSPLLMATPPHVTRALAYSHPFILPLNKLVGLLSWTTADPWESFLFLASFWCVVLYGDVVIRWAGPLVVVTGLIMGMYSRRYSPLSSSAWSGKRAKSVKKTPESDRKSLDEILDTLQTFTARCEVLLDPFIRLTEFLSTQSTATSATTRPALTTLFLRIMAVVPIWAALTLPPLHLISTRRVVLVVGTICLSWHSRPALVSRTLLWRSRTVRAICTIITGLNLAPAEPDVAPPLPPRKIQAQSSGSTSTAKSAKTGVQFTFAVYENQRRWLGLGWTHSMLTYERQAWTDELLNTCQDPPNFELPATESGTTEWRWVQGSVWHVVDPNGQDGKGSRSSADDQGWTYYDNKWQYAQKEDGWGRYTRQRKWVRDAELVDVAAEEALKLGGEAASSEKGAAGMSGADTPSMRRRGWFGRRSSNASTTKGSPSVDKSDAASKAGSSTTGKSTRSRDEGEDGLHAPHRYRDTELDRSIGDGLAEGLS